MCVTAFIWRNGCDFLEVQKFSRSQLRYFSNFTFASFIWKAIYIHLYSPMHGYKQPHFNKLMCRMKSSETGGDFPGLAYGIERLYASVV